MHMFLLGWFEKFTEFKSRDFFLSGESYAGLSYSLSLHLYVFYL